MMLRFQDIIGHQGQIELLRRAVDRDRLHHAYIFVGPEGTGKRTVATALAAAIQCQAGDGDACGECPSCLCIRDGNHADLHWLEQRKGKRDITIEQVRELQKQLVLRRFTGRKKIAIIDPLTLVNLHAQNALLKTLEEPPEDSLLILIAESTGDVLPTVLSRCL
ncbi:MAG: DNA polymerase III subunit delta', partial [Deltaproteobacteria bacterium]|nr:DNA polymerase III subunit delta' [Deltaproteobacteria bacterium]